MRPGHVLLVVAAALALSATGCSTDERGKSAFRAKADALCKASASGLPKRPPITGAAHITRFITFIDLTADNLDPLAAGLGSLEPPKSLAHRMGLYVENLSYMNVLALRAMEATHAGRYAQGLEFVNAFDRLATENAPLVDHLGFDACGPEGPPKPSDYRIGSLKLTATES